VSFEAFLTFTWTEASISRTGFKKALDGVIDHTLIGHWSMDNAIHGINQYPLDSKHLWLASNETASFKSNNYLRCWNVDATGIISEVFFVFNHFSRMLSAVARSCHAHTRSTGTAPLQWYKTACKYTWNVLMLYMAWCFFAIFKEPLCLKNK